MKITKDNLLKIQDEPIELFYQGMKADDTKSSYTRRLRLVLCDYFGTIESFTKAFHTSEILQQH